MNFMHCLDIVGVKYSHSPLSLPTLAALTPEKHDMVLIDESVEPVDMEMDADLVAISGTVPQRKRLFELAKTFKAQGKTVAIGGPITFDMPKECQELADVIFIGEGEYTWPRFMEDLEKGSYEKVYCNDL